MNAKIRNGTTKLSKIDIIFLMRINSIAFFSIVTLYFLVRSNCFHVKVCKLSKPLYWSIKLCLVVYRQHTVTQKEPQNSPPSDFLQIDILTTKQFSLKVLRVLLLNPPYTNLPE